METKNAINFLIEVSETKYNVMKEIYELTKKQKVDIENGNGDSLLSDIEKKQEKIEEVNSLDKQFYSIYIKIKQMLNINSIEEIDINKYPNIKDLKNQVANVLEITKKIDEVDKINMDEVKKEFEKVKNEMKSLKNNVKASRGYNTKYNYAQGVFIDNKK